MKNNESIPEEVMVNYLIETLEGCMHLKNNSIYHRDIKPENLLIVKDHIKLTDFGVSKIIES